MTKISKTEALEFIKHMRGFYKPTGRGYKILDYLEDLVNTQGGKKNEKKKPL